MVALTGTIAQKMKVNVVIWCRTVVLLERRIMNIDNRRLREVQRQLKAYRTLLEFSDISESLIYQGKIEALEREEKEILKRYDVKV